MHLRRPTHRPEAADRDSPTRVRQPGQGSPARSASEPIHRRHPRPTVAFRHDGITRAASGAGGAGGGCPTRTGPGRPRRVLPPGLPPGRLRRRPRREELGLTETELIVTRADARGPARPALRPRGRRGGRRARPRGGAGRAIPARGRRLAPRRRPAPGRTTAQLYVTCIMGVQRRDRCAGQNRVLQVASRPTSAGAGDQDAAGGLVGDPVRDAAEDAGGAVHALVADDDEVGVDRLGDRAERVGGVADRRVGLDGEALGCAARRPCGRDRPWPSRRPGRGPG